MGTACRDLVLQGTPLSGDWRAHALVRVLSLGKATEEENRFICGTPHLSMKVFFFKSIEVQPVFDQTHGLRCPKKYGENWNGILKILGSEAPPLLRFIFSDFLLRTPVVVRV